MVSLGSEDTVEIERGEAAGWESQGSGFWGQASVLCLII